MSNEMSSGSNDVLKTLNSSVTNDTWLQNQYSTNRAEQQTELKRIFTIISDNNVSEAERQALEARAKVLQQKIQQLEDELASLKGQITESQEEIQKHLDDIATLIASVDKKSAKMETDNQRFVRDSVDDVFRLYESGKISKDAISTEIRKRIKSSTIKNQAASGIQAILSQLDAKKSEIDDLTRQATGWIDKKAMLESQYGVTKSAYSLIKENLKQIGSTTTSYTNSDTDTKIPVYTPEKTNIASELYSNLNYNVQSTNSAYVDETEEVETEVLDEEAPFEVEQDLNEQARAKEVASEELSAAASEDNEVAEEAEATEENVEIIQEEDVLGKLSLVDNKEQEVQMGYVNNVWDTNKGNTIASNEQILALSRNYSEIFNKLANSEPKFTFKEAMYLLFNPKNGLFKDSGVIYDVTKQDGNPTYDFEAPGDEQTAQFYKDLSESIEENWGVSASQSALKKLNPVDINKVDNTNTKKQDDTVTESQSFNGTPFTFSVDNTEYAFVIDRNNDNKFDGTSEFAGANTDFVSDLRTLDTNNDGKLSDDELKNLKLFASSYQDGGDEPVIVEHFMTSASNVGISEIDLSNGVSITLDGASVGASQKEDVNAFMQAVYNDATGKSFTIALNEEDINTIISGSYSELDDELGSLKDAFVNIDSLLSSAATIDEAKNVFAEALDRTNREESVQTIKADSKVRSLKDESTQWSDMSKEVEKLAERQNVSIDIEKINDIYSENPDATAQDILDSYVAQKALDGEVSDGENASNEIKVKKENLKEANNAYNEISKLGLNVPLSRIVELLNAGKVKNSKEAVEYLKEQEERRI